MFQVIRIAYHNRLLLSIPKSFFVMPKLLHFSFSPLDHLTLDTLWWLPL